MASMLTTAPVRSMLPSTSGMAVISLLFSSTALPAMLIVCSSTHAESMWVYELEDFDPRIRLPSIEISLPSKSSTSVLPKTDRHSAKAVGSIREITLSIVSTLGQPLGSSNNGFSDSPRCLQNSYITRVRPKQPAGKRCVQSPQRC